MAKPHDMPQLIFQETLNPMSEKNLNAVKGSNTSLEQMERHR